MKVVNAATLTVEELKQLLTKPAFDQVVLSEGIRAKNKELFGEDLTAAEVVEKIVNDVRIHGDADVIKYTKLIDGADFRESHLQLQKKSLPKQKG